MLYTIFPNVKIVLSEVGYKLSVAIHNANRDADERGIHADDVAFANLFGTGVLLGCGWLLLLIGVAIGPSQHRRAPRPHGF
jgi:hypothetical protein